MAILSYYSHNAGYSMLYVFLHLPTCSQLHLQELLYHYRTLSYCLMIFTLFFVIHCSISFFVDTKLFSTSSLV